MRNLTKTLRDTALWWSGRGHALPISLDFRAAYMWHGRDGAAWANEHMPGRWRLWQDSTSPPTKWQRRVRRALRVREDVIYFRTEDDLILFKLRWSAELSEMDQRATIRRVILPTIKKVMPSIIARDIIGVQPMTGPAAMIFMMQSRYVAPPSRWQRLMKLARRVFLGETHRDKLSRELEKAPKLITK